MTHNDWSTMALGAVFGLFIAVLLYLVFHALQCPAPWIP
jgi:hypothetical protein